MPVNMRQAPKSLCRGFLGISYPVTWYTVLTSLGTKARCRHACRRNVFVFALSGQVSLSFQPMLFVTGDISLFRYRPGVWRRYGDRRYCPRGQGDSSCGLRPRQPRRVPRRDICGYGDRHFRGGGTLKQIRSSPRSSVSQMLEVYCKG